MPDLTKPFKIWLPQDREEVFFEVKGYDSDNTEYDLKPNLINFSIDWPTIRAGGLASFTATLNNSNRQYLDVFTKANLIKFYFDYTDGSTLYKVFKMEEPKFGYQNGYKMFLHGRDYPEVADEKITIDYTSGWQAKDIFDNIVTDNFSSTINTGEVDSDMTDLIYPGYEYKSPILIFADVLERVDYDGRFENDGTITTFEDTGVLTTTEAAIVGQNITNIAGFGAESEDEYNRILVVGKDVENMPVLRMKEDTTEQGTTWIKTLVYKNSDISDLDDALDVATFLKDDKKTKLDAGTIGTLGMMTIKPGQQILCSAPNCKIVGEYFVKKVTQSFTSGEGMKTSLELNETRRLYSSFFEKEKRTRESERDLKNPNFMSDTLILLTFDNEDGIDTLGNVQVDGGKLKLAAGQDTGDMISNGFSADENWTECEVRAGCNDDCDLVEFFISNDDGNNYTEIGINDLKVKQTLITTGKQGRLKVRLRSDSDNPKPEIDSVALLIKRT